MEIDPDKMNECQELKAEWEIREGTCYLNHGSFGIAPTCVRDYRKQWIDRLETQPMDFYLRQLETEFHATRGELASLVGTDSGNLVFVENATYGMNIVANSFPLREGDEVLLTSHEYGAVQRIWDRRCKQVGAIRTSARLELPLTGDGQIMEAVFGQVTARTRLIVISHITSETGMIFPVSEICREARKRGIAVCIDGPHAVAQVPLQLDRLDCDFYAASCHKWLCAPLGSGFLYVAPRWQPTIEPLVQSWGRLKPASPQNWDEEFVWMGTRDPSAFFSIRKAIAFLRQVGLDSFRSHSHALARAALEELGQLFQTRPPYPLDGETDRSWFGSMCELPLPDRYSESDCQDLQWRLWQNHRIEVPVFHFENQHLLRVSFHLYNSSADLDYLLHALRSEKCHA